MCMDVSECHRPACAPSATDLHILALLRHGFHQPREDVGEHPARDGHSQRPENLPGSHRIVTDSPLALMTHLVFFSKYAGITATKWNHRHRKRGDDPTNTNCACSINVNTVIVNIIGCMCKYDFSMMNVSTSRIHRSRAECTNMLALSKWQIHSTMYFHAKKHGAHYNSTN